MTFGRNGTEQNETFNSSERNGAMYMFADGTAERNGMERDGAERNGMKKISLKGNDRTERNVMERNGTERNEERLPQRER